MDKRYLLLRKRGWYVRYAIPQKVQHYFGKTEFVVSLKTRSLEEAKIKNSAIWRVSRMPSILIFVILILIVFSRIVLNP